MHFSPFPSRESIPFVFVATRKGDGEKNVITRERKQNVSRTQRNKVASLKHFEKRALFFFLYLAKYFETICINSVAYNQKKGNIGMDQILRLSCQDNSR